MDRKTLEKFDDMAAKLRLAVRGLPPMEVRRTPPAEAGVGSWSVLYVVAHLVDAQLVLNDRMKRVISEDNPPLINFDETLWAQKLHYDEQTLDDLLDMFQTSAKHMFRILTKLTPGEFSRVGTHSKFGKKTLADLVQGSINHVDHHIEFINKKRKLFGK